MATPERQQGRLSEFVPVSSQFDSARSQVKLSNSLDKQNTVRVSLSPQMPYHRVHLLAHPVVDSGFTSSRFFEIEATLTLLDRTTGRSCVSKFVRSFENARTNDDQGVWPPFSVRWSLLSIADPVLELASNPDTLMHQTNSDGDGLTMYRYVFSLPGLKYAHQATELLWTVMPRLTAGSAALSGDEELIIVAAAYSQNVPY
jgi:hypothetical protein